MGKMFQAVLCEKQEKFVLLEQLIVSDVGRLLSDLQHDEVRKNLILANLNTPFKEVLTTTTSDELLFGKSLEEGPASTSDRSAFSEDVGNGREETVYIEKPEQHFAAEGQPSSGGTKTETRAALLSEILVEPGTASTVEEPFPGSREVIVRACQAKHIPEEALHLMISSLRLSLLKQYDCALRKWWNFCQKKKISPFQPSIEEATEILAEEFKGGAAHESLNSLRSASRFSYSTSVQRNIGTSPIKAKI
ncbi:uncharacterized protein [Venturia canescens]|uniref:uncharacterized protein n=1 Tax=Venturia canescens TaxID=32260 RepID=UPI001C9BE85B|nr:uncharacterized protein LOC122416852 [Venturia canescens]